MLANVHSKARRRLEDEARLRNEELHRKAETEPGPTYVGLALCTAIVQQVEWLGRYGQGWYRESADSMTRSACCLRNEPQLPSGMPSTTFKTDSRWTEASLAVHVCLRAILP